MACYRRAIELKPDFALNFNNLGNAFKDQGDLDQAIAYHRRARAESRLCRGPQQPALLLELLS